MDELNLDFSGVQDPVTTRVSDLISLCEALDRVKDRAAQRALKDGLAVVLEDLKQMVIPRMEMQSGNVIPFPGGRDVH